jgi:hypothetical protein
MADGNSILEFRDVPNFPGYRVGNDGSVWSQWDSCRWGRVRKERWRRMKLSPNPRGYPRVNLALSERKTYKTFRVHRLVLEAFVGPCPDGLECRHKNGVKTDNRLENLIWGTPEENRGDNHTHGTYQNGENHSQAKLEAAQVLEIRRRRAAGESLKQLAEEFGVNVPNISSIVNRRSWKHLPPTM